MKRVRVDDRTSKLRLDKSEKLGKIILKRNKNDFLTLLPKDLKLNVVKFLTRSEALSLGRCSSYLKSQVMSDNLWKAFIMRISPSLLDLPMRAVTDWKDKLKVFLMKPIRKKKKVLRMHLILKFDGVEFNLTLSNWRIVSFFERKINEAIEFFPEQDFQCDSDIYSVLGGTIMLLFTYDGMTSLFLPEFDLEENDKWFEEESGILTVRFELRDQLSEYRQAIWVDIFCHCSQVNLVKGVKSVRVFAELMNSTGDRINFPTVDIKKLIFKQLTWY